MRRLANTLVAFITAVTVLLMSGSPAAAHDDWCGDAENHLSSYPAMHLATFGSGGNWCPDERTDITYECARYWLPTGQTDSDIQGYWFDTDAFMLEQTYDVDNHGTWYTVDGGKWWKISNSEHVSCQHSLYRPVCKVITSHA